MRKGMGRIDVFTFKEGLLSRAAHDLQFRLDEFTASIEGEEVRAELRLENLRLVGPVERGVTHPDRYDAGKRADVEKALRDDVLHIAKHPTARFTGRAVADGSGFVVTGNLELAGARAPLDFAVTNQGGEYRARFELHPSRWGIAPYRAMLGALRLKDLVRIDLAVRES